MSDNKVILVAGGAGQVARALAVAGVPDGVTVVTRGRPDFDLLDIASIDAVMDEVQPDLVVNAAAYTAVDQAETDSEAAFALNAKGPGDLAGAAARRNVPIIHLSTDYVFDGTKAEPYSESDPVAPLGVYGQSKLAGEQNVAAENPAHIILRTAWVYSPWGKNFVKTMLRVGAIREELTVVHDQRGNPTSALDIASGILAIADRVLANPSALQPGVYHMTAADEATWAEFAEHVFACSAQAGGPVARVRRITSAEYPTPVTRPANSRLDCARIARAFGVALPPWQGSAQTCVVQLVQSGEWNS